LEIRGERIHILRCISLSKQRLRLRNGLHSGNYSHGGSEKSKIVSLYKAEYFIEHVGNLNTQLNILLIPSAEALASNKELYNQKMSYNFIVTGIANPAGLIFFQFSLMQD